jgi:CPA2 family monovalent cation:H+ antiporter-2
LREYSVPFIVLDMNPHTVAAHRSVLSIELGDATQLDVLRHAGVARAQAVVITAPDPWTSALIVAQVKRVGPLVPVVARARYHRYAEELKAAGAEAVVDEEDSVGDKLAGEVRDLLRRGLGEPGGS